MYRAGSHALYLTKFKRNNHWVCIDAITCNLPVTEAPVTTGAVCMQWGARGSYGLHRRAAPAAGQHCIGAP